MISWKTLNQILTMLQPPFLFSFEPNFTIMKTEIKKYQLFILSVIGGLILGFAWPSNGFSPLVFIGLVPFFIIEEQIQNRKNQFLWGAVTRYVFPGILVWNLYTTWWVINSSLVGAILAFTLNSLLMALVFQLYHFARKYVHQAGRGYIAFPFLWISWEYFHMNWEMTWSWLNLGNVFASDYKLVQWYEYTGTLGGTLWVIIVNILIFIIIQDYFIEKKQIKTINTKSILATFFIVVPIIISLIIYGTYKEKGAKAEIVISQPNIDPYNDKFTMDDGLMINILLNNVRQKITPKTELVILPETAIQDYAWEESIRMYPSYDSLKQFILINPNTSVLTGWSTRHLAEKGEKRLQGARDVKNMDGQFYYVYNTALLMNPDESISKYHKSKLVPGVEIMPFAKLLKPLEKYAIDLGGTFGSLGVSEKQTALKVQGGKIKVAPVICYESIYGEFVTKFIRDDANLIAIITNDGWWGDTPGHRQHYEYARLRAIETRRDIARSANTGFSGFFNQRGDDFQKNKYWVSGVEKREVRLNGEITTYVKFGDYIARISVFMSAILIILAMTRFLRRKII